MNQFDFFLKLIRSFIKKKKKNLRMCVFINPDFFFSSGNIQLRYVFD